jgi:transcriptional regulator with XRE-family HTH domain
MIDQPTASDLQERLAANLRRLRIARHLTLSELARATGMSKATLSGIENGRANPTIETLAGLAAALRVSVVELVDDLPVGDVRIVRAADGGAAERDGLLRREIETVAPDGRVHVAEMTLDARQQREMQPLAEGSRVRVYVLRGALVAGPVERSTELGKGDYMAFPADVPHVYATGRHAAHALLLTQEAE